MSTGSKSGLDKNPVLIFEPNYRLIAIVSSIYQAARLAGCYESAIRMAISGRLKTTNNLYFRKVPSDMGVEIDDLYSLTLQEYDEICGLERQYVAPKLLINRPKKYSKEQTPKNKKS